MSSDVFTNAIAILLSLRPQANDSMLRFHASPNTHHGGTEARRIPKIRKTLGIFLPFEFLRDSVSPWWLLVFMNDRSPPPRSWRHRHLSPTECTITSERRQAAWTCDSRRCQG